MRMGSFGGLGGRWGEQRWDGEPGIGVGALRPQWGARYWGGGIETPVGTPILGWGH